jgi:FHS family Na+ dependent glucose MFS transporter 1
MGLFGLLISSLGPVLPDLSNQVSVPLDVLSLIFTARAFGFLFGSLLGGKLLDNYKSHPLFSVFFLLLSLMIIMIPLNTSFWLLVGIVFIQGISLGFVVVGASTLIIWEHPQNSGPWLNTQSFINGVGAFLSPLVISLSIIKFGSYSYSFWFYALLACLLSTFFLFMESPLIRKIEKTGAANEKPDSGLIYLIALIFLLYVGAEVSFNGWIFSIATTAYTIPAVEARLLNSIFWGCMAVGRLAGVWFSKKIRADRILILSFTGSILSVLAALIFPHSKSVLWAGTIGMGLFMALIFPSLMMYAEKRVHLSGKNTGLFFSATSVGGMLLPWISGQFFIRLNPHAVKAVVLTSLLSGFAVFLYVMKLINSEEPQI